jgi:hypothetical protein
LEKRKIDGTVFLTVKSPNLTEADQFLRRVIKTCENKALNFMFYTIGRTVSMIGGGIDRYEKVNGVFDVDDLINKINTHDVKDKDVLNQYIANKKTSSCTESKSTSTKEE